MRSIQETRDALDRARDELLLAQRQCAWCDFRGNSADALVDHIVAQHQDVSPAARKLAALLSNRKGD